MVGHRRTLILGVALLASAFVVGCSARAESRHDARYGDRQESHRRRSTQAHESRSYGDHGGYGGSVGVEFGND